MPQFSVTVRRHRTVIEDCIVQVRAPSADEADDMVSAMDLEGEDWETYDEDTDPEEIIEIIEDDDDTVEG